MPFLPHQNDASTASVSLRSMHGLVGAELKMTIFGGVIPLTPRDSSSRVHVATYTFTAVATHVRIAADEKPFGHEAAFTGLALGLGDADGVALGDTVGAALLLTGAGVDEAAVADADGAELVGAADCWVAEVQAASPRTAATATTAVRRTPGSVMPRG